MNSLLAWLLAPPRALQQANDEIVYLREEVRRLNDVLTQVYESARVIPRQPEHREAPQPVPSQRKTMGEMQMEAQELASANYHAWQRSEAERLENARQANGSKPN